MIKVLFIENAGLLSAGAFHSLVSLILNLKEFNIKSYVALPPNTDGKRLLVENEIEYIEMKACSYSRMIPQNASRIEYIKLPVKNILVRINSLRLVKFVNDNDIDIIHENTSVCYIGMYVARLTRKKHIWHIREFVEEDFGGTLWPYKASLNSFKKADAVIAISNAIKKKYEPYVLPDRMHMIYNGVDIKQFYDPAKSIMMLKVPIVLCVGRVSEGKGQKLVVEAVGLLKKQYGIEVIVKFAGLCNEDMRRQIENIAINYGIVRNVKILGQCNNMLELYQGADILCMASRCEAFGRVTVEAMLRGVLVLGANTGGTKEIIEDGVSGILFEANNCISLCLKLKEAVLDKERSIRLAANGRERAKALYDSKINAEKIYNVYCQVTK